MLARCPETGDWPAPPKKACLGGVGGVGGGAFERPCRSGGETAVGASRPLGKPRVGAGLALRTLRRAGAVLMPKACQGQKSNGTCSYV